MTVTFFDFQQIKSNSTESKHKSVLQEIFLIVLLYMWEEKQKT